MADILIVEDDKTIQNLLKISLKRENHTAIAVSHAKDGINYAINGAVDLVILDLGLPDMDGINVVKAIREINGKMPIIIVSARSEEQEKIKCLDAGANDYVEKPFSSAELMARIRAALRYAAAGENTHGTVFVNGDLKIDYAAHSVFVGDREVHLTNLEYKLLCVLAQNVGKTLTHNYIITNVWGAGGNDSNGLRVFMANIRRKIEKNPYTQELIRTEVGVGYRMNKI